ncbi:MAG: fumarylacetoacetate hydrolase family protein [Pseudomonadota bacterium]
MKSSKTIKKQWFNSLLKANEALKPVESLSSNIGELSLEEAYEVQAMLVQHWIRKGERVIGWKVGATSRSVMDQLRVSEPIFGCMTSKSDLSTLMEVKASGFCRLAVEGEIAFLMGAPLKGPGITRGDVMRATSGITGAIELVDSRIKDWDANPSEAVADNAFHAGIMLGPITKPLAGFDLIHEGVVLRKNAKLLASACGVEALGNPINVVVWLANKLAEFGKEIGAGEIVSTGSLTNFFFIEPGDVLEVSFSNLGTIQFAVMD